jgi:CubicO group peptidase (beta-lactamase class C family)
MFPCRKWTLIPLLFAASLLLVSCGGNENKAPGEGQPTPQAQAAVWPGADWEVSTPEGEGMDATRLEDVASYCEQHKCGAVVVTRHGRIVWERYWGEWDESTTDNSMSMSKSVTDALVGIAISEGKIKSVDESVADFIPEWRGTDKAEITVRNLLSMTSGLLWDQSSSVSADLATMSASDDQAAYVISRPRFHAPGTDWYYSNGDAQLFSAVIKAATGMEVGQYAQEKLFGPIGMKGATWLTDKTGHTVTYCCVFTTARNFARFGYLFLRNGRWNDQQVVPADWVKESTERSQSENLSYGFYWWLADLPDVPKDMFMEVGSWTKRTYVIPSLDIVAVRIGADDDETWDDNAFLKPIVEAVKDK